MNLSSVAAGNHSPSIGTDDTPFSGMAEYLQSELKEKSHLSEQSELSLQSEQSELKVGDLFTTEPQRHGEVPVSTKPWPDGHWEAINESREENTG